MAHPHDRRPQATCRDVRTQLSHTVALWEAATHSLRAWGLRVLLLHPPGGRVHSVKMIPLCICSMCPCLYAYISTKIKTWKRASLSPRGIRPRGEDGQTDQPPLCSCQPGQRMLCSFFTWKPRSHSDYPVIALGLLQLSHRS